jgi:hypothetical protein
VRIAHLGTGESLMPNRCWQLIENQSEVAISGWSIDVVGRIGDAALPAYLLHLAATFDLLEHPDDLGFCESGFLHLVLLLGSLRRRTPIRNGTILGEVYILTTAYS